MSAAKPRPASPDRAGAEPLYMQVKRHVTEHVVSGHWPEDFRLPSEHELVRTLGVSRMTVHRALRELTADGLLTRVQGVGTFVAARKPPSAMVEIRNIADEIRERGHRHRAEIVSLGREPADEALGAVFRLPVGAEVYHSVIVHHENDVPVQYEDRYVNPVVAPDYLKQDFSAMTPNEYLMVAAPLEEVEHVIEAVMPDDDVGRRLHMAPGEPCLLLRRRTWSGGSVASTAKLYHPGTRHRVAARFTYVGPAATHTAER